MTILAVFLLGLMIGAILATLFIRQRTVKSGIAMYTEQRTTEKQERKNKIIAFAKEKSTISNDDVQSLLNISDATATNYLQELERDGALKQIGTQGRYVRYTKANPPNG